MKILAYIIFGLDKILYDILGVVTPIRRTYWRHKAKELQKALDYQHKAVDKFNKYAADKMTGRYYVENYGVLDNVTRINRINEL